MAVGSGTLAYAPPIVVSVPAVNVSGVAGAISAEQMMQLSMMQSGGGSGYSSGGGSDQGGNGSNQGNVAPKTLDEMKPDELKELTPEQLDEMKPEGWKFNQSPDGRFVHIKDSNNNYRIRIDPPDKVTPYRHIHIYDADGNALDINGNIVPKSSPDAHIPYNNI